MNSIKRSIVNTLAYYQIFEHPLNASELLSRVASKGISQDQFNEHLADLTVSGVVLELEGYFFLEGDASTVKRRVEGEARAKSLMKRARYFSSLIYAFPFVRAVFISGSLSKGSVPEDADIDYFIITKKHRLWIARTSLVMFKRLFLLNSKKYFCTNYFIDEETLEIPDKNIFTATEVSTLVPMRGNGYYDQFLEVNDWYKDYFPNLEGNGKASPQAGLGKKLSRALIEPLFIHSTAEKLDKYFMKKTYRRWMTLYGKNYTDEEFELAFRSRRGTSKNHDKNYQKKVLKAVELNSQKAINRMKKEAING